MILVRVIGFIIASPGPGHKELTFHVSQSVPARLSHKWVSEMCELPPGKVTTDNNIAPCTSLLPLDGKQQTRFTWLEGGQCRRVEAVPELVSSPLPGLTPDRCGGEELPLLEVGGPPSLPAADAVEGGVLAGSEGAQLLLLRHLEAPGAQDGIGFVLLLISV